MLKNISWRKMVRKLHRLGFRGPDSSGKHLIMARGDDTIHIPNPHRGDISKGLLTDVLREARISRDEWNSA